MQKFKFYKVVPLVIFSILKLDFVYAKPKNITARYGHSAVYDESNKKMLIFGGANEKGFFSDTWVFDTEKKTWEKITTKENPTARCIHSAIYIETTKQMFIFGGNGQGGYLSDTWIFDIEKKEWEEIESDEIPPTRTHHSVIYDSDKKQMIVFGGTGQTGYLSDMWKFDVEKKTWEEIEIGDTPPARSGHRAIYDSINKKMIIFGGAGSAGYLTDTWIFDIEKKKWEEIETDETPPIRAYYNAIYDSDKKRMIVFWGSGQTGPLSDIWVFDIEKKNGKRLKLMTNLLIRSTIV